MISPSGVTSNAVATPSVEKHIDLWATIGREEENNLRMGLGGCVGVSDGRASALISAKDAGASLPPSAAAALDEVDGAVKPDEETAVVVVVECCATASSGCVRSTSVGPLRGTSDADPARAELLLAPGLLVVLVGLAGDCLLNLAWNDWNGDFAVLVTFVALAAGASSTWSNADDSSGGCPLILVEELPSPAVVLSSNTSGLLGDAEALCLNGLVRKSLRLKGLAVFPLRRGLAGLASTELLGGRTGLDRCSGFTPLARAGLASCGVGLFKFRG